MVAPCAERTLTCMPSALAVDNLTIMGGKGSGKQSKAAKAKSAATALVRTLYSCTGCACQPPAVAAWTMEWPADDG